MPKRRLKPISGLIPIAAANPENSITKGELATAFGCDPSQISRDASTLWGDRTRHRRLSRRQAFTLYAVACFRLKRYELDGADLVRADEILAFASSSEEIIQSTIAAVGGSDGDFEQRLEGIFAARAVRRFEPITFEIPSIQIS